MPINSGIFLKDLIDLLQFLPKRRKKHIVAVVTLMFLCAFLEIALLSCIYPYLTLVISPQNFKEYAFFDVLKVFGISDSSSHILVSGGSILLILIACTSFIRLCSLFMNARIAAAIGNDLSKYSFRQVLIQPFSQHMSINSSNIISTLTAQINLTVSSILCYLQLISSFLITVSIFAALLIISWSITLNVFIGLCIFYGCVVALTKNRLKANSSYVSFAFKYQIKIIQEALGSIRELILLRNQPYYSDLLNKVDLKNLFRSLVTYGIGGMGCFWFITRIWGIVA